MVCRKKYIRLQAGDLQVGREESPENEKENAVIFVSFVDYVALLLNLKSENF